MPRHGLACECTVPLVALIFDPLGCTAIDHPAFLGALWAILCTIVASSSAASRNLDTRYIFASLLSQLRHDKHCRRQLLLWSAAAYKRLKLGA